MYRYAIEELKKWKNKANKKPLVIEGARQVGKTWLMKEFGNKEYENTVYINFDVETNIRELFSSDLDVNRLIKGMEIYTGTKIDSNNTLIIFDEIQESPRALASLKYFYEVAPEYHIVCAGSLLGIAMHSGTSFPVGKVEFLKLYPLSFNEFLKGTDRDSLAGILESADVEMITSMKSKLKEALKEYYFVGGMPEAVMTFSETGDYDEVREVQNRILNAYEQDFSKHAPTAIVPKIRMVWESIPSQLSKENKKFIYGVIRDGARAKEFEAAIMWLSDCGLIHKVSRVTKSGLPLKAYENLKAFKIFMLDIGLLGCMTGISQKILLDGDELFTEFKGALTEQYVLQQLKTKKNMGIYYYTNDRGSCEIDFLLDDGENVIPVEVKAELNLKAKSFRTYMEKYKPEKALRISMTDYNKHEDFVDLPLYMVEFALEAI